MTKEEMLKEIDTIGLEDDDYEKIAKDIKTNISYASLCHLGFGKSYENLMVYLIPAYIMIYKLKYPVTCIAEFYNMQVRAIQQRLKVLGWNYTMKEAQQIASEKSRDYGKILLTKRMNRIDKYTRDTLEGSNVERYVRHILALKLTEIFPDMEVVVGVNDVSILRSQEVDIPVIIFGKENTYKFAIEVNSYYHHRSIANTLKSDAKKKRLLKQTNYQLLTIWDITTNHHLVEEYGSIETQINKTINIISETIQKNTA